MFAQWSIPEPMVEEIMAGGEGTAQMPCTLFCVGDVKQTLYGWRTAEPGLFEELTRKWPQLQPEKLLISYRSSPAVIDTVNEVFENLLTNQTVTASEEE